MKEIDLHIKNGKKYQNILNQWSSGKFGSGEVIKKFLKIIAELQSQRVKDRDAVVELIKECVECFIYCRYRTGNMCEMSMKSCDKDLLLKKINDKIYKGVK